MSGKQRQALTAEGEPQEREQELALFEVLLARNVLFPYRYAQEYIWLEVMADDAKHAVALSRQWVLDNDPVLESTGLVRRGSTHPETLRVGDWTLRCRWDMAVEEQLEAFTEVRHPHSGLRIGFLAPDNFQDILASFSAPGACRLLLKKPTHTAAPVCIVPAVFNPEED